MPHSDVTSTIAPLPTLGTAPPLSQVSDEQLARYAELIYARTGIRVSPQKKMLLSNRLRRRLRQTGLADFDAYFALLRRLPPSDAEWDAFLQEITTHETYLFRDEAQWRWFREQYLTERMAAARQGAGKTLRVWSAACSTGDEAATAACCIAATLTDLAAWQIRILGTDIGVGALEQAREAVFGERAMRLVPPELQSRFFTREDSARVWRAKLAVTTMLSFRQHNLLDPLRERPFDLVFLKNVLIYFDAASKRRVVENVRAVLKPGGLLVVGAAEGVSDLVKEMVRLQPWLFAEPAN